MNSKVKKKSKTWVVYILRCADNTLYTGITNNMNKRLEAHHQGTAAKYTRSRRPVELLTTGAEMERGEARRLEMKIQKLPRAKKIAALEKYRYPKSAKMGKKTEMNVRAKKKPVFNRKDLHALAKLWRVNLKKLHDDIQIQGSPERSVFRIVLEDDNGKWFVLEQIDRDTVEHKKQIAGILHFLANQNLSRIQPYLLSAEGGHIIKHKNNFWQMVPFVHGVELDREKYMYDEWRGPALADFLIELRRKSPNPLFRHAQNIFSLKNYVYKLIRDINLYKKDIKSEVNDIACFLEKDFIPGYDKIPVAFCHGDYHPLNIIWSVDDIQCVIDWEFCGYKSDLYDAANLIGCVGVEDPQSLTGMLVKSFIAKMKVAGVISVMSWKYLVEYIVALRFAWLSEWLRKKDSEMISLELDYMRLLIDHKNGLQKAWL
jgi:homoserine kinase type II